MRLRDILSKNNLERVKAVSQFFIGIGFNIRIFLNDKEIGRAYLTSTTGNSSHLLIIPEV